MTIFIIGVLHCKTSPVQGTKQKAKPVSHILLGPIENRDLRYHPHINENFRDMIKFDLIEAGYAVEKIELNQNLEKYKTEEMVKDTIGGLPLLLRKSAGENGFTEIYKKQLNAKQIFELSDEYNFDYFLQGSLALHTNGKILDSIDHNLFFLDIYSKEGIQIGMIRFAIEEKTIYEANLMKNLSNQVVTTFHSKLIEVGKK